MSLQKSCRKAGMYCFKLRYHNEVRRLSMQMLPTLEEFISFAHAMLQMPTFFKLLYADDEGDMVVISSNEEFQEALRLCAGRGLVFRVHIVDDRKRLRQERIDNCPLIPKCLGTFLKTVGEIVDSAEEQYARNEASRRNSKKQRNSVPVMLPPELQIEIVEDIEIPGGYQLSPNENFVKMWKLRNVCCDAWRSGDVVLRKIAGEPLGILEAIPLRAVPLSEVAEVSIALRAPPTAGSFRACWAVVETINGITVSPMLNIHVIVIDPDLSPAHQNSSAKEPEVVEKGTAMECMPLLSQQQTAAGPSIAIEREYYRNLKAVESDSDVEYDVAEEQDDHTQQDAVPVNTVSTGDAITTTTTRPLIVFDDQPPQRDASEQSSEATSESEDIDNYSDDEVKEQQQSAYEELADTKPTKVRPRVGIVTEVAHSGLDNVDTETWTGHLLEAEEITTDAAFLAAIERSRQNTEQPQSARSSEDSTTNYHSGTPQWTANWNRFQVKLEQLEEMGLHDREKNARLLLKYRGDILEVVKALLAEE